MRQVPAREMAAQPRRGGPCALGGPAGGFDPRTTPHFLCAAPASVSAWPLRWCLWLGVSKTHLPLLLRHPCTRHEAYPGDTRGAWGWQVCCPTWPPIEPPCSKAGSFHQRARTCAVERAESCGHQAAVPGVDAEAGARGRPNSLSMFTGPQGPARAPACLQGSRCARPVAAWSRLAQLDPQRSWPTGRFSSFAENPFLGGLARAVLPTGEGARRRK